MFLNQVDLHKSKAVVVFEHYDIDVYVFVVC